MSVSSQWVTVENDGLALDAYLAQPREPGTYPAIVVFQEIFGVNAHIRAVTEQIAAQGYVAIAPALYQRLEPGFEVGYSDADLAKGREYKVQTQASELLSDTQASLNYLKGLPTTTDQFGCIGFCFGGHVAYLAATLPDIQVTASCYGAGIAQMCPGQEVGTTCDRTPAISGTLYAFFGTEDPLIPLEDVDTIEEALQEHNIDHKVFRYEGATHGFLCDQRDSYHPEVAKQAWSEIWQLFSQLND